MADEMKTTLLAEFPPVSTEEWEREIRKDFKDEEYSKRLLWRAENGIPVKLYYRREDLESLGAINLVPGQFPYTRGVASSNTWSICQEIDETDLVKANVAARNALAGGADEICFCRAAPKTEADIAALLAGIETETVRIVTPDAVAVTRLLQDAAIPAAVQFNPEWGVDDATTLVRNVRPGARPIVIHGADFLEAGGTTVQEAGFTVAAGISYLSEMTDRGIGVDAAAGALCFQLAIGTSYFFQIAKLRAFRMLWARAVEAFGGSKDAAKAVIHVRTARWNKTIYDPHVNLLRATAEAMSAAIGGCDSLTVGPFDETYRDSDEFSRRLARNTQLILKYEAWLDRVADPAGGSYYIEVLTESVAREGWKLMQETESAGGYREAARSGMVAEQIARSRKQKDESIAYRRKIFVGANQYPNLGERMLDRVERTREERLGRGPEIFEDIRLRTERHAAAGGKIPLFLIAEMGDAKMRRARAAFGINFFGCGGFDLRTEYFADVAALANAATALRADAVVLCSSDEEYPTLANAGIQALKGIPLIVAGHPKNEIEQLRQYGVADFVHIGSNAAETLAAWQDRLGMRG